MEKQRNKLFFALAVVAIFATMFFISNHKVNKIVQLRDAHNKKVAEVLSQTKLQAQAVSVYDITDNKKIFGQNDDVPMSIASLAKIMTVVVGLVGRDLDEVVYVSPQAVRQAGDFGIFAYEKWKIGDLSKLTLMVSANDGAYALSENTEDILNRINNFTKKMGLVHTVFFNVTGLDILETCRFCSTQPGAIATAEEVNAMSAMALRAFPEVFGVTTLPAIELKSESGYVHNFKNTDILVEKIPNLLFSKTGYTEFSGGNLAIIFKDRDGHLLAVTVLGSTFQGRFSDMEKIVEVLYSN